MQCKISAVGRSFSADTATTIASLCSKGNLREAFQRFRLNIFTNPSLFTPFIQSSATKHSIRFRNQLRCLRVVSGFSSDKFICNHLMSMYSKLGDFPAAVTFYGFMPKKNYMSSNILINGYFHNGDLRSARKVFDEMAYRKLPFFFSGSAGLRSLSIGQQIHRFTDLLVNSSLAHMYMRNGNLQDGEMVIRSMPIRNFVAWNTLL